MIVADLDGACPELFAVKDAADQVGEVAAGERFGKVAMTATLLRALKRLMSGAVAKTDDGDFGELRLAANSSHQFEGVRLRQIQIKQDKIGLGLHTAKLLQDIGAGGIAFEADALFSQEVRNRDEAVRVILDYERPQVIQCHIP